MSSPRSCRSSPHTAAHPAAAAGDGHYFPHRRRPSRLAQHAVLRGGRLRKTAARRTLCADIDGSSLKRPFGSRLSRATD